MDKTKIEWADATWNPVTGCLHGCSYCYARRIATRFAPPCPPRLSAPGMEGTIRAENGAALHVLNSAYRHEGRVCPYPWGFEPTLHRHRLDQPQKWKEGRTIFVCSMADLFGAWVPDAWIEEVFAACLAAPQHRYLFLTKNPLRYYELQLKRLFPHSKNFWWGSSVTNSDDPYFSGENAFVSFEPLMEDISAIKPARLRDMAILTQWAIIGAETGNRKGKVTPKAEWVKGIAQEYLKSWLLRKDIVPVFMKDSLRGIVPEADFRQHFPWEGWTT